jgi:hypothetical protein
MFPNLTASLYQSNQYSSRSGCGHCGGMVRHENWCITCDPEVQYAYEIVLDPGRMTIGDRIILHALGVSWVKNLSRRACAQPARI